MSNGQPVVTLNPVLIHCRRIFNSLNFTDSVKDLVRTIISLQAVKIINTKSSKTNVEGVNIVNLPFQSLDELKSDVNCSELIRLSEEPDSGFKVLAYTSDKDNNPLMWIGPDYYSQSEESRSNLI